MALWEDVSGATWLIDSRGPIHAMVSFTSVRFHWRGAAMDINLQLTLALILLTLLLCVLHNIIMGRKYTWFNPFHRTHSLPKLVWGNWSGETKTDCGSSCVRNTQRQEGKRTAGSESMSRDLCEMTCMAKRGRERAEEGKVKGRDVKGSKKKKQHVEIAM